MILVVGLGNPGAEYAGTRHNVGFEVVDWLAARHGFPSSKLLKGAQTQRGIIGGKEVMLAKPQTYMNLSGDAVGALVRYFKLELGDLVVVHDELDFEPGVVRVKRDGGHGGNNGVRSIIGHLGRDFVRVRVGIGKPKGDGAAYVLSRFDGGTRRVMDAAVATAGQAVEAIVGEGVEQAMQQFNQRASSPISGAGAQGGTEK